MSLCQELECSVITIQQACTLFVQALLSASLGDVSDYSVSRYSDHVFRTDHISDEDNEHGNDSRHCLCGLYKAKTDENLRPLNEDNGARSASRSDISNSESCSFRNAVEEYDGVVIDSFTVGVSALKTSVLTACSVLKIGQVVENL